MNIPIISDGSFCVGETVTLVACCSSNVDVTWEIEMGAENVNITGNGSTAELQILNNGGYKIKASCCTQPGGA